jgi:hypothetical protein
VSQISAESVRQNCGYKVKVHINSYYADVFEKKLENVTSNFSKTPKLLLIGIPKTCEFKADSDIKTHTGLCACSGEQKKIIDTFSYFSRLHNLTYLLIYRCARYKASCLASC